MTLEGKQLDRWQLQRLVGEGPMGKVYLAENVRNSKQAATKIVSNEGIRFSKEETLGNALRPFWKDMRAVASLVHPRIVPLFDFGEQVIDAVSYTYFVTPFYADGSLLDWLERGQHSQVLSLEEVVWIVRQAADALQYTHGQQMMHLDIKLSNFLMTNQKDASSHLDVVLADFGIASFPITSSLAGQTRRGAHLYRAPEQWAGIPRAATDQYALAVVAYQLLTAKSPFEGNLQQVIEKHLYEPVTPPGVFNPRLPPEVDRVIMKALSKRPEARFPAIKTFADALSGASEGK